jgi:uncharacterized GH25 family protein
MLFRIALAATTLFVPAFADDETRLSVEVQTLSGKPIDRASVIVDFVEGRSIIKLGKKNLTHWEVRTNQEGVAKIPPLPEGKVRVQVIAKGYQTFGQTFEVSGPEKTLSIKLNPPQRPYSAHQ